MQYRKSKETTHQTCRSLLQKTIRRGYEDLACKIALHLLDIGDKSWLKNRCVVICAEECWPDLLTFEYSNDPQQIILNISRMTRLVKNKDAAGLGSLGFALSKGDETTIQNQEKNRPVHIIANAIKRPDAYWQWLMSTVNTIKKKTLIEKFISLHKKAGWPWDKAFIQAAGYLLVHERCPKIEFSHVKTEGDFPIWVALDKHTKEGKDALRDVAKTLQLPIKQLEWISFYLESSKTNERQNAYWWKREMKWRLEKVGVNHHQAIKVWEYVQPEIINRLSIETKELSSHINQLTMTTQNYLF